MKKLEYICDKCKESVDETLITEVEFMKMKEGSGVFDYMNRLGLLKGTGYSCDLCPQCLQQANWLLNNFVKGIFVPVEPV